MKRRIISCLLIVALFLAMIPNTVYAQEIDQRYTQDQMDAIVQKYDYNEDMLNSLFCVDTAVGYWGMANNIKQNGVLAWALDMSSRLIGEYPEKQDYAEMLANLITMQSGELAEQIETQSRFDDLKDVGDYAWDVIEIAAAFVGASDALKTISAAIDTGVSGIGDVIIKNNEQAKYYEVTLQEYSQSDAFLHAISKNAENEELRNVAASLLRANETLLVKRLEYLADAGANIAEYEAEFFIKNMSMELLKEADLYVTDETVKFFVDEGISLKNAILAATDAAKFAFKMVILAGDIGFGTSDVYNRYQEMKAVADIAASLVKANKDIYVPSENTQETLEVIQGKCILYKALIVTHARGEYLLYQLLMNDAGALSDIRWIIEYFKNPEETTKAWYDGQIEVLTKYCNILDEMFALPQKDNAVAWPLSQVNGKKLAQINVTYSDGNKGETVFKYNSSGLLTSSISTYSDGSLETVYSYDSGNRLTSVQINSDAWYAIGPKAEYFYDSNGFLIKSSEAEGSRVYWLYENDENGRHVRSSSEAEGASYQSVYSYNEDATQMDEIRKQTDYEGNVTTDYISYHYDKTGQIIREVYNGTYFSYTLEYSYNYKPFVFVFENGTQTYHIYIPDKKGNPIWEIEYIKAETMKQDNDGYLTQLITDSGVIYEFVYEGTNEADTDLLTVENQYELNCFLSYFSQQWFNEVDPKTYETKTDSFTVQNADPAQLIRFVDLYTKINNGQVWYDSLDQDSKVHLSLDYINDKLQQFFGISILPQDVQKSGYELRDGNIYFDFAMGETYNYMTVVRSCEELSNGTVCVEFDIYRGEGKYMYAGGPIIVEDVYWYSTEDARRDADLVCYKSGTATVRPIRNGNNVTYQLLKYGLDGQSQSRDDISFSDIPSEFVFSSGAGGWGTYLTIEADGSFKGEYHDSDMGITGEGYPRGTVYICGFDGKFAEPQKVSEYVYSMKLESLNVKESAGTEYIENEIRYIVSEPYGMENADEFYIYLPGASLAELPEAFLSWSHIDIDVRDTLPSGYYGIYNAGGEKGFTATEDDCIWNRDYMYYYQNRKAAMWPRYYGKSHVLFWPESGASVIDLQFAWKNDNQTEFDAYDANGSGEYHIKFDISDDMSTVNVSATSVNGVDLSSWGGTSDGHFTATFADDQSIQ